MSSSHRTRGARRFYLRFETRRCSLRRRPYRPCFWWSPPRLAHEFRKVGDNSLVESRIRLLTNQSEISDVYGVRRVAEIIDFQVLVRAAVVPQIWICRIRDIPGNQIGDPGIAFPPVLMCIAKLAHDRGEKRRVRRVGDIKYFLRLKRLHARGVSVGS